MAQEPLSQRDRLTLLREFLDEYERGELATEDDLTELEARLDTIATVDEIEELHNRLDDIPTSEEIKTLHNRLDELETGGGIDDERLDRLYNQATKTLDRVERSIGRGNQFYVGPDEIADDATLHTTPLWSVFFETDRELYFGDCTIKALAPGRITATVYEYTGGLGEPVAQTPIDVIGDEREQDVRLDMHVPPGRYFLTRPIPTSPADAPEWAADLPEYAFEPDDDAVSLAMQPYQPYDPDEGWVDDNQHGTRWLGKGHPNWSGSTSPNWYYYYSLEVVTAQSAGDLPE